MKSHLLFLSFFIVLTLSSGYTKEQLRRKINQICGDLIKEGQRQTEQTNQLANKMNYLIISGQVEIKDAFKPKNKEISELSFLIEKATKKIQQLYDSQDYVKFCLLLEEEEKYGELQYEKQKEGLSSLLKLKDALIEEEEL